MNRRTKFDTFTRGRLSVYAVLAAAALGLTACGGDAEGQPGSSASPVASAVASEIATPTSTPSATPEYKPGSADGPAENVPKPKLPKEANEESLGGLRAYANYWYELLNYGYESGDSAPVRNATSSQCKSCIEIFDAIDYWHSEGRWVTGGSVEVMGMGEELVRDPSGVYQLPVQIRREAISYYANDSLNSESEASEGTIDLFMASYDDSGWTMHDVGVIESP